MGIFFDGKGRGWIFVDLGLSVVAKSLFVVYFLGRCLLIFLGKWLLGKAIWEGYYLLSFGVGFRGLWV